MNRLYNIGYNNFCNPHVWFFETIPLSCILYFVRQQLTIMFVPLMFGLPIQSHDQSSKRRRRRKSNRRTCETVEENAFGIPATDAFFSTLFPRGVYTQLIRNRVTSAVL